VLLLPVIIALFIFGYLLQYLVINRVVKRPVLTTLTLTFGLDMILYNFMNSFFEATPRRISLNWGSFTIADIVLPIDRLVAMALAFILTFVLYLLLRTSKVGRAIVAVRMDRDAASLMGIQIPQIYAITFGLGAAMAGACGVLFAVAFPVTTNISGLLLGKAFVICVIGGLGSVPGALIGGLALGLIESFGSHWFGPQHAITIGFILMLILLMVRPTGLLGVKGYE
jgi:branched-chain amino acid transport system permease protein